MRNEMREINLEEVHIKYSPLIRFKIKRSLGASYPDWEDIVTEIITNIITKIKNGEYRGESSIGTFIYAITSRRIIYYLRKKSKVMKHVTEPASLSAPHEQTENKDRDKMIAKAIRKLKPKYRKILYLYYYKEFSREEVAQRLGITPRRVSELVNCSQKLLKKMIKK